MTDSTNEELVYTRNKIRRELIPYLEKNLNPNAVQKLTELADSVLQAEEYIEQQAAGLYEKAVILQPQENPSKPSVKLSVFLFFFAFFVFLKFHCIPCSLFEMMHIPERTELQAHLPEK